MRSIWLSLLIFLLGEFNGHAQDSIVLHFGEFMAQVKAFHPIAKQGRLNIDIGAATLQSARGGFDPVLDVEYDRKDYKGTEYFDRLRTAFKVPTWFGLELNGKLEDNRGEFLNRDQILPEAGQYSLGVTWEVGLINERMATLRRAKLFKAQSEAERDLAVNAVLYDASLAYFEWLLSYRNLLIFDRFVTNARFRFQGIRSQVQEGELAPIDSVEAKIALNNRILSQEQAAIGFKQASLILANYLWIADDTPVELNDNVIPDLNTGTEIDLVLDIDGKPLSYFSPENHPLLSSMQLQVDQLKVDQRLKTNQLLPRIEVAYNFLTDTPALNTFENENYKAGVDIKFPLFLRKERGDLRLAKYRVRDAQFRLDFMEIELQNRIRAIYQQLISLDKQVSLSDMVVRDYDQLLRGEERKFSVGESSLFLVNSRESQFISAELKRNEVEFKKFKAKADLFKSLGINPNL